MEQGQTVRWNVAAEMKGPQPEQRPAGQSPVAGPQYGQVPNDQTGPNFDATPYELAPLPHKPALPGTVVVRESADEVIDAIAADLFMQARNCVRTFGDFHLALSGGSTPEPLYRRLMYDPGFRELPWKRTHLWLVDERRVPPDDDRSNFKMIRETIVMHSDIPREQVHPINTGAAAPAVEYEAALRESLAWREKGHDRLDFVVLGMGEDGHTASLFPHSPALGVEDRLVTMNSGPRVTPPERITMTYNLINASRFIAILITGEKKRPALERVLSRDGGRAGREELPILGVAPLAGELRWYLDKPACPPPPSSTH
jgi:6-phosphogluconolactonase